MLPPPDLALYDVILFPSMKELLNGSYLQNKELQVTWAYLQGITKGSDTDA